MLRVLLVAADPRLMQALHACLRAPDLLPVALALTAPDAVRFTDLLEPDVVVLALAADLLASLKTVARVHGAYHGTRVVLIAFDHSALAGSLGADACVALDQIATDLAPTIRAVQR